MIIPIRTRTKIPVTIREAMDMDAPGVVTEGVPMAVAPTEVTLLGVKILYTSDFLYCWANRGS